MHDNRQSAKAARAIDGQSVYSMEIANVAQKYHPDEFKIILGRYTKKINYGTVVQLCTVRNKRKLSAKKYKGVGHMPAVMQRVQSEVHLGSVI